MGTAAASSYEILAGFKANAFSLAHTYSANVPLPDSLKSPKTSSPGWNCVTFLPTVSTRPATSAPRNGFFWFWKSSVQTEQKWGTPQVMPIRGVQRCSMNFYQDFILPGSRFVHFFELKNIRGSILCVNNRFHLGVLSEPLCAAIRSICYFLLPAADWAAQSAAWRKP